jgi:hypothetical protein
MANVNITVTLGTKGNDAGPLYDIYYSADCVSYTIVSSNAYLPFVGSQTTVIVPDTTRCIKLVNLNGVCDDNFVVSGSADPTTTTTIAPTTTTTTTITPTTTTTLSPTTTTLAPTTTTTFGVSYCWKIVNTTAGSLNVEYYNTINEPVIIGVPGGSTDYLCVYGGTTPTGDPGVTIELCGIQCTSSDSCTNCVPPTTTTAAPTTTTLAPTTTTTTVLNGFRITRCSDGLPYDVSVNPASVLVVGDVFKSNSTPLGGDQCWSVDATSTGPYDYTNILETVIYADCFDCQATLPTTTTTLTPTTTVAPTTTTTAAPTTYLVEPCGGGLGPYIVTLASGDTPSGIGQAYKISGNSGAGFNGTTCWEVLEVNPVGSIDYSNLAFGSVFSNCAECNPPTTTTLSPTTTQAPTTTTTTGPTADLDWSFTESGGANGTMDIYINGVSVISASTTTSGLWTGLEVGDEIYFDINVTGCSEPNEYANAYSIGIITDAACDLSVAFLSSAVYIVTSGDLGTTLNLDLYASCDGGCV